MGCCKNSLRSSDELHLEHKGLYISPKFLSKAPLSSHLIQGDTDEIIEQIYCFDNTHGQKALLEKHRLNNNNKTNHFNIKEEITIYLR